MTDSAVADEKVSPNASTILATDRTRLAHDRTLMAWVRTATSLISFGFTIYKFFQYLQQQQAVRHEGRFGPRQYGTLMIALGIIALVIATVQHRRDMKILRAHYPEVPYSMVTILAGLISLLGVIALVAVIFRQ